MSRLDKVKEQWAEDQRKYADNPLVLSYCYMDYCMNGHMAAMLDAIGPVDPDAPKGKSIIHDLRTGEEVISEED